MSSVKQKKTLHACSLKASLAHSGGCWTGWESNCSASVRMWLTQGRICSTACSSEFFSFLNYWRLGCAGSLGEQRSRWPGVRSGAGWGPAPVLPRAPCGELGTAAPRRSASHSWNRLRIQASWFVPHILLPQWPISHLLVLCAVIYTSAAWL